MLQILLKLEMKASYCHSAPVAESMAGRIVTRKCHPFVIPHLLRNPHE
ncbi:hypothetical protein [Zhouia amylolytica]|nr:hypothetical protein [Zhouia amylolytica]